MKQLKQALFVLRQLKNSGYDAYFVGGCVRDYLLKREITDIDITTNASPSKVMKLFNAKPTGLKYGTVSFEKNDINIEITTYRIDGEYLDNRHPEEVVEAPTVEADVQRRDFTMNGLVMDDTLRIHDFVGGKEDVRHKMIRSIGDPDVRFKEDSLRILRAIYFQSKLGFQIEKQTRDKMSENKDLIDNLPNERVINELLKILKGDFQLRALRTLEVSQIADNLPGLSKGIKFINENIKDVVYIDAFFALCFALEGKVPSDWKFSNVIRHKYEAVVEIVNSEKDIDAMMLYNYGLEICVLSNKVSFLLNKKPFQKNRIEYTFENLAIRSVVDLKFKAKDLIELTNKKQGAWVSKQLDELVIEVLQGNLLNTYDDLKAYCAKKEAINNEK